MKKRKVSTIICKECGAEIAKNEKVCSKCGAKNKKPLYKRGWFIALVIVVGLYAVGTAMGIDGTDIKTNEKTVAEKKAAEKKAAEKKAEEKKEKEEKKERKEKEKREKEEAKRKKEKEGNVEEQIEGIKGKTLDVVTKKLSKEKYTAKYYHNSSKMDYTDTVDVIFTSSDLPKWVAVSVYDIDKKKKSVSINIDTKANINLAKQKAQMKKALEKKLSCYKAKMAMRDYGKSKYIYGFELHSTVGVIAERPKDANTWFFKIEATVTNAYGTEARVVCEAEVSGTTAHPIVKRFTVY